MKRIVFAVLMPILAGAAAVATVGNAQAADGKALFVTCQACHGAKGEGNRQLGAPNIAGMEPWYVERQLASFASGMRGADAADGYGAQMRVAVANVPTPADKSAVAAYIASLPRAPAAAAPNIKGDLAKGSTNYNAVCSACHGAGGLGNVNMQVPRLAGVDTVYLARQFAAYRAGKRGYHKDDKYGKQMRAGAGMLDARLDQDVMAYIATLKP